MRTKYNEAYVQNNIMKPFSLSILACVCMCVCTHVHVHTHIHTSYIHIYLPMCEHTYLFNCMRMHIEA